MHDDRTLVEARLERALGQFVRPARYAARVPLVLSVWHVPGEPVPVDQALQASYEPFTTGTVWGKPWSTSWFRLAGRVPEEWAGRRVEAVIDPGFTGDGPGFQAEGLLYDAAGVPLKGIHPRNRHLPVASPASGGEQVDLLLEAAANPAVLHGFEPTHLGDVLTAGDGPIYRFRSADLAVLDEEVWQLVLDVEVLSELMHELPMDRPRRHEILRALEDMLDALDLHDVSRTATAARAALVDVLSRPASTSAHRISATGHAHIDSAWLWPLRETVRKASRTFANVTALAADYPELVFACSQAQQVRLGEGAPAAHLGADQADGGGRQLGAGRLHVGGVGRQHARRRGAGPADRARQAVLRRRIGRGDAGDLAAGLLRLHGRLPAAGETGRNPLVPHPETQLEPVQPDAPPHLLVGGHRRHPRLHPLPARRHLQLPAPRP